MNDAETVPVVAFPDEAVPFYEETVEPLYQAVEDGDFDAAALESIETDERGLSSFVAPFPSEEGGRVERDGQPDIIETGHECGAWFGLRHAEVSETEEPWYRAVKLVRRHVTTDRYRWNKGSVVVNWSAYDLPLVPKAWESRFELVAHIEDRLGMEIVGEGRTGLDAVRSVFRGTETDVKWFESQYERLFYPEDETEYRRYEKTGLR